MIIIYWLNFHKKKHVISSTAPVHEIHGYDLQPSYPLQSGQFYEVKKSMKLKLVFIDQPPYARYCSKYLIHGLSDNPFNPHNKFKKNVLSPFLQMRAPVLAFPLCHWESVHESQLP